MEDQTKHGTPVPPGANPAGQGAQLACSEFEALLTDALEGLLSSAKKEGFDAHRRICPVCGPLFADVEAGRLWLRSLEPVEPPVYLVHNILAATTGVVSTRLAPSTAGARTTPFSERVREWWDSWFSPVGVFVRQPRFVMSFGMVFFTFSLIVSAAGVKASDVARIDLRPSALRRVYNDAQIKVVQYYDNIRFVYEIESRVRELRRAATPPESAAPEEKEEKKQNRNHNDTSGQPEQRRQPEERQDRNYSREGNHIVLAGLASQKTNVPDRRAGSDLKAVHSDCSQLAARSSQLFPADRRFV